MYTTHVFNHKNSKDYITIGDPYEKKKGKANPRYRGKQFQTAPPKKGQTAGFFGTFNYKSAPYQDMARYLNREPQDRRKQGFGSHDARRRDEFTLDIRARQYREMLRQEDVYTKTALAAAKKLRPESAPMLSAADEEKRRRKTYRKQYADRPHLFQTQVPFQLYEIGKSSVTPPCNKCSRETFYCPHRVGRGKNTLRRPGTASTASQVYGNFGPGFEIMKPKHGNINTTKQFFDQSHLKPGW